MRAKIHERQDIAFDLDARGDLDQFQRVSGKPEDGPFGDIEDFLPGPARVIRSKGNPFDMLHELTHLPRLENSETAF